MLSCDTCGHKDKDSRRLPPKGYSCYCNLKSMWVHMYCKNWMEYVGCASHSTTRPVEQAPVPGQYIITEDQLRNNADGICLDDIMKIRSRPVHQQDQAGDVLDVLDLELQEIKSRIESSAMGQPLSERSRGEIIGLLHAREKIKYLRQSAKEP